MEPKKRKRTLGEIAQRLDRYVSKEEKEDKGEGECKACRTGKGKCTCEDED